MPVWGEWGLVFSLNFFGWLILRIPGRRSLELGHSSISGAITLWAMLIHLSENGGRLEAGFCLSINRFFNQCVSTVKLSPALFHLDLNRGQESSNKFNKVRLIMNFHLLIGSLIKFDSRWYTRKPLSHPNSFKGKLWTQPKARDFQLPSPNACAGANKSWFYRKRKKLQMGYNWCQWRRQMILAVFGSLFDGLRVRDDGLEPRETNPCRTLSLLKVFFGILSGNWDRNWGKNWTSCISWYESLLLWGVPKSIWIAVLK